MIPKSLTLLSLCASFHVWSAPRILTKSKRKGVYVSDTSAMKAWLKKMPHSLKEIQSDNVSITNIDVKWKQKKVARKVAKAKKRVPSYTCTLELTIKFEDVSNGEAAPSQVATPAPLTVNSRCDTFLANNDIEALIKSKPHS